MSAAIAPAAPGRLDLHIQQGAGLRLLIAWKPGGVMADLTSYTARAQVRASYDAAIPLVDLSTANGHITIVPGLSTHNLVIWMYDWETAALTDWGTGVWDLLLTPPAADSWRILQGLARLNRQVAT